MKPEGSLLFPQEHATVLYLQPDEPRPQSHVLSLKIRSVSTSGCHQAAISLQAVRLKLPSHLRVPFGRLILSVLI